jgi:hypothetical protein
MSQHSVLTEPASDDEIYDSITVRPDESASQRTQTTRNVPNNEDNESSVTVASIDSYTTLAAGKSRARRSHIWDKDNGMEYKDEKGKLRWRCKRCR